MTPLILIKHSLPEIVKDVPAREWRLSELGRDRARELAERLRPYRPGVILSSVEHKARETAVILGEALGLKYQTFDNLHEHDRSQSPFYPQDEFEGLIREFFEKPDELVFGSESADQALTRFRHAVEQIVMLHKNKTIAVVSHGTVMSVYVAWMSNCDGHVLWQELGLPALVVLDLESNQIIKIENIP